MGGAAVDEVGLGPGRGEQRDVAGHEDEGGPPVELDGDPAGPAAGVEDGGRGTAGDQVGLGVERGAGPVEGVEAGLVAGPVEGTGGSPGGVRRGHGCRMPQRPAGGQAGGQR